MQAALQTRSEQNASPQNQKDHKQKQQKEKPKQHQQRQPNDRPQRNRRQRKPNKRTELQKSYSMLPNQHKNITQLLKPTNLTFTFHPADDDDNNNNQTTTKVSKEHDTSITGKFHCRNTACSSTGWSSKAIPTTIRLYADNRYNARIYHQRCKECNWLAKPVVTGGSYAERVTYWLKRWSGVEVERPPWGGGAGRPHVSELCEGCRVGRCKFARVGGERR